MVRCVPSTILVAQTKCVGHLFAEVDGNEGFRELDAGDVLVENYKSYGEWGQNIRMKLGPERLKYLLPVLVCRQTPPRTESYHMPAVQLHIKRCEAVAAW